MEHRWGERAPVSARVRLKSWPYAIGSGHLRDVSASGAYIRTNLELPVLAAIDIEVELRVRGISESHELSACVVRSDHMGIGIEWTDFAPAPITALVASLHGDAGVLGDAAETARPITVAMLGTGDQAL